MSEEKCGGVYVIICMCLRLAGFEMVCSCAKNRAVIEGRRGDQHTLPQPPLQTHRPLPAMVLRGKQACWSREKGMGVVKSEERWGKEDV